MLLEDERVELCAIGRRLADTGLVTGASGNISVRSGTWSPSRRAG